MCVIGSNSERGFLRTPKSIALDKQPMGRPPRPVIAQVLAESVTPLLERHGFGRRGRTAYDRARDGRRELVTVEPHHCSSYGGRFTVNLGIFIPEVDAVVSLYPLQAPPQDDECHIRCRIGVVGSDGRVTTNLGGNDMWWEFDAETDLAALGAEVRQRVEYNGLKFFANLSTLPGIVAWLRTVPIAMMPWPHPVALAAYAGAPELAQRWLHKVVADASSTSDWYRNWLCRKAALIAGRLGLECPAPTDTPALSVVFRVTAETTPQDRYRAFHDLDFKYRQYVEHFRTLLPAEEAAQLYHTAECTIDTCAIAFYGADPEKLLHRLRRSFDRLSEQFEQFEDITWRVNPDFH